MCHGAQVLATDHCPFNSTQKANGLHDFRKIPNGVNGLEERLHMGWDTLVGSGAVEPVWLFACKHKRPCPSQSGTAPSCAEQTRLS